MASNDVYLRTDVSDPASGPALAPASASRSMQTAREDTFAAGTPAPCTFLLTSVESHASNGNIISVEDWVLRRKLRDDIVHQVLHVVERMAGMEEDSILDSTMNIVPDYLFPIKTWQHMMDDQCLPKNSRYGRIIYELDANRLKIREVASAAHDAAANSLNTAIGLWSTNLGLYPESLVQLGQARNNPITIFWLT